MDYATMLGGATGSLGLGGGVGTSDSAPSSSGNATATGGPISSSYGDIRGGGTRNDFGNYFNAPGRDEINPPTSASIPGNVLLIAAVVGVVLLGMYSLTK